MAGRRRGQPTQPDVDSFVIDSREAVGPVLREIRTQQNLTQAELAAKLIVVPSLVTLRERGMRTVPSDRLIETLAACGWRLRAERIPQQEQEAG